MATKKKAAPKKAAKKAVKKANNKKDFDTPFEKVAKAFNQNKNSSEFFEMKVKGSKNKKRLVIEIPEIDIDGGEFGWYEPPTIKDLKEEVNDVIDGLIQELTKSKII